jgi:hypothetical protein
MATYDIIIDEAQRALIAKALKLIKDQTGEEIEYLIECFDELPEQVVRQQQWGYNMKYDVADVVYGSLFVVVLACVAIVVLAL